MSLRAEVEGPRGMAVCMAVFIQLEILQENNLSKVPKDVLCAVNEAW